MLYICIYTEMYSYCFCFAVIEWMNEWMNDWLKIPSRIRQWISFQIIRWLEGKGKYSIKYGSYYVTKEMKYLYEWVRFQYGKEFSKEFVLLELHFFIVVLLFVLLLECNCFTKLCQLSLLLYKEVNHDLYTCPLCREPPSHSCRAPWVIPGHRAQLPALYFTQESERHPAAADSATAGTIQPTEFCRPAYWSG